MAIIVGLGESSQVCESFFSLLENVLHITKDFLVIRLVCMCVFDWPTFLGRLV